MEEIAQGFTADHRRCDQAFVDLERAIAQADWNLAAPAAEHYIAAMEHHFQVEEEELFPALLRATGAQGPVQVMRMEHAQMRQLFTQLGVDLAQHNRSGCLDLADTLLMIMQQHNLKEEHILYPMADQALEGQAPDLLQLLGRG
jgi:hemerythrin-like domain-containing protein